jgi:two-component system, NarL family, sensor histidine kinase UhpB
VDIKILIIAGKEENKALLNVLYITNLNIKKIKSVIDLKEAEIEIKKEPASVIFLELHDFEKAKLDLNKLVNTNHQTPIILSIHENFANSAFLLLERGASDFIVKDKYDEILIEKTIRFAIKSKTMDESLLLSNNRYELVSKATTDMVWDWDLLNSKVFRSVEGWEKIFGKNENNENLEPDGWRNRIHPDDKIKCDKAIEKILQDASIKNFELEYRVQREDNTYMTLIDRGYAMRNDDGQVIRLIGATNDISDRKELEKKLAHERRKRQNEITNAVITAQEQEREQLGRELHDNINQILTTSKLYIEYSFTNEAMSKELLVSAKGFVESAVAEIRNLTKSLMPPTLGELGLTMALKELVETLRPVNTFNIFTEWEGIDEGPLVEELKLTIFRIIQEQINNITKHANAQDVWICMKQEKDSFELSIVDNGKGFDIKQKPNGVGIKNIFSRAQLYGGAVSIESEIEKGCKLTVLFKL